MTLDIFTDMVHRHDLTYSYSDDAEVWRRGSASLHQIEAVARTLPRADVVRIWNAEVDRCLSPSARTAFYWSL